MNIGINTDFEGAMVFLSEMWMLILPIIIINLALVIAALISLIRKEVKLGDKVIWLILILFVQLLGPVLYFAMGSGLLDKRITEGRDTH